MNGSPSIDAIIESPESPSRAMSSLRVIRIAKQDVLRVGYRMLHGCYEQTPQSIWLQHKKELFPLQQSGSYLTARITIRLAWMQWPSHTEMMSWVERAEHL